MTLILGIDQETGEAVWRHKGEWEVIDRAERKRCRAIDRELRREARRRETPGARRRANATARLARRRANAETEITGRIVGKPWECWSWDEAKRHLVIDEFIPSILWDLHAPTEHWILRAGYSRIVRLCSDQSCGNPYHIARKNRGGLLVIWPVSPSALNEYKPPYHDKAEALLDMRRDEDAMPSEIQARLHVPLSIIIYYLRPDVVGVGDVTLDTPPPLCYNKYKTQDDYGEV